MSSLVPRRPSTPPLTTKKLEALTLLAALQREARFVDLVQESLDAYTDAQIGGAARDVLRDCRKTLDRMFALKPTDASDLSKPWTYAVGYAGFNPFDLHLGRQIHWDAKRQAIRWTTEEIGGGKWVIEIRKG